MVHKEMFITSRDANVAAVRRMYMISSNGRDSFFGITPVEASINMQIKS